MSSIFGIRARQVFHKLWRGFASASVLASAAGLAVAFALNRFFALVLGYLTKGRSALPMPLSPKVLAVTVAIALLQTALSALGIAFSLRDASADILFRAESANNPHTVRWRTALGLPILMLGYAIAAAADSRSGVLPELAAVGTVIAGTFLSMEGLCFFALQGARRRVYALDPSLRLALPQLASDLGRGSDTLALAAVFVAIAVTTGGTIFSFASNDTIQVDRTCPNVLELGGRDQEALSRAVTTLAQALPSDPAFSFRRAECVRAEIRVPETGARFQVNAMSLSTWRGLMRDTGRETRAGREEGEILGTGYFHGVPGIRTDDRVLLRAQDGTTMERIFRIIPEGYALSSSTALFQIVLADADWDRLALSARPQDRLFSALWNLADIEAFRSLEPSLEPAMDELRRLGIETLMRTKDLDEYRRNSGALLFIGVLMMAAFLTLAFSALLFRQWGSLPSDRSRLRMLDSLGTRAGDAKKALRICVASTFSAPFALGFLHAAFAFRMLANLSRFRIAPSAVLAFALTWAVAAVVLAIASNRYILEAAIPAGDE